MEQFLVEIPMNAYARCLAKCEEGSRAYMILRDGIVLRDDPHRVMIHIRCDAEKVQLIRRILAKECPEFLDEIHYYPDPPPK